MILPVKAPAAAPAAAPIDAARTFPVAAPPMIAPVAAPHAAPWSTGVSHDVSMQQLTAMTELTVKNGVRTICFYLRHCAAEPGRSRGPASIQPFVRQTGIRDKQRLASHVSRAPTRRG